MKKDKVFESEHGYRIVSQIRRHKTKERLEFLLNNKLSATWLMMNHRVWIVTYLMKSGYYFKNIIMLFIFLRKILSNIINSTLPTDCCN
jgi:hypothetical protein